ncbi:MAG: phosphatidate cytidylyltransferase [Pseudomonadota bacterium]|nr:phosphatidate cytidylyltransferase [Pseudomonadota bacterium]
MLKRTLSTLVLAPAFLCAIWFGFPYFHIFVGALSLLALMELIIITTVGGLNVHRSFILLSFLIGTIFISLGQHSVALALFIIGGLIAILSITNSVKDMIWLGFGYFYLTIGLIALIEMRALSDIGHKAVLWFFAVIWANDIGAYLIGRQFGSARIAPRISPGKTWAGAFGGLAFAALVSCAFYGNFPLVQNITLLVLFGVGLGIGAQVGDLLESYFKRIYGIKDSGALIPGHGGALDRSDSILFTAPITLFLLLFNI